MFYPVAKYLDEKFGHRTTTHSLLCYFVLSLTVELLEKTRSEDNIYSRIFIWAYGSHLILDMLTAQGMLLFYPFKKIPCVSPGKQPKVSVPLQQFQNKECDLSYVHLSCLYAERALCT